MSDGSLMGPQQQNNPAIFFNKENTNARRSVVRPRREGTALVPLPCQGFPFNVLKKEKAKRGKKVSRGIEPVGS